MSDNMVWAAVAKGIGVTLALGVGAWLRGRMFGGDDRARADVDDAPGAAWLGRIDEHAPARRRR